ncbi:DUF3800 domain-containing protein [Isoptericola cucumis]|uniref:DUF3800 domain-containing protein n=1 Tax=Isoptericola cucumis TaxID=1776856 RepID=UPI00166513BC|nr:DUF3800 domain-containing protein [Isoptericola cucumis]
MYLCYVDDSGDSRRGTTLSALIVEAQHWSGLLDAWLTGRREIHRTFGVRKHAELHANQLYKGRGKYCETSEQERSFGTSQRAATGRIMLSHLSRFEHFQVVTVASPLTTTPTVYAKFIAWLEDWAERLDAHLMVFYDGQQGLHHGATDPSPEELSELWKTAVRNATPYRRAHRDLDLSTRRVVEDVIMQDSQYSQLIQAVDLIAYGAYHLHRQDHPEIWGTKNRVQADAIRAYMRTHDRWVPGAEKGIVWLDPTTQEPPA